MWKASRFRKNDFLFEGGFKRRKGFLCEWSKIRIILGKVR